jgi:hypothetical protein
MVLIFIVSLLAYSIHFLFHATQAWHLLCGQLSHLDNFSSQRRWRGKASIVSLAWLIRGFLIKKRRWVRSRCVRVWSL